MILSDKEILKEHKKGNIEILPFHEKNLGTNSYDVRLAKRLLLYDNEILDVKSNNPTRELIIPDEGMTIHPNKVYLGSTLEYTKTEKYVPFLEGRSSIGRLGIDIHATAGVGDVGFRGHWTLEISCSQPVRIYPHIRIGQLIYMAVQGEVGTSYQNKESAKYNNSRQKEEEIIPVPSKYYKDE